MSWTFTITVDDVCMVAPGAMKGDQMNVIKIACVSDASGGSCVFKTEDANLFNNYMKGGWLYMMKVVPNTGATQPAGTFDIDIEDKNNDHILDTDANANDATTFTSGADTLGIFPPILNDLTMVVATLGNTKTADIYLYINR